MDYFYKIFGPELTYYEWTINEEHLNSILKIEGVISRLIKEGESNSISRLVLGSLKPRKNLLDKKFASLQNKEEKGVCFGIKSNGTLFNAPKKGKILFIYYYYYDHSTYTIEAGKAYDSFCFDIKSFQNEAILTEMGTSDFELTAEESSGGGTYQIGVLCNEGQFFQGTVENQELLIEKISDYLTKKNIIEQR